MLGLKMRTLFLPACLLCAALAPGQTVQAPAPNALKLPKYILDVDDVDAALAIAKRAGGEVLLQAAHPSGAPAGQAAQRWLAAGTGALSGGDIYENLLRGSQRP